VDIQNAEIEDRKKQLGKRINEQRLKSGLTLEQLASSVGLKKASISQLENGKNFPSLENLILIANRLDVDTGWLLQGSYSRVTAIRPLDDADITLNIGSPKANIYYVPNPAQAGIYRGVFDYQHSDLPKVYIPGFENVGDAFLFHVEGESMYPFLSNGDMVIAVKINSINEVKPGFAYVVCTREMLVVKRIQRIEEEDKILLISDNSEVQDAYKLHVSEITNIFLVRGAITTNTSKRFILGR
jgi:transcriptional regulator with XRE-family HTH domain